jgi:aryl-alcohol dehydrogenase-like predicted oxidoreductase
MSIEKRKLGTQGLEVSSIGFGCMSLTGGWSANSLTKPEGIKVIHKAIELGYTFLIQLKFTGLI